MPKETLDSKIVCETLESAKQIVKTFGVHEPPNVVLELAVKVAQLIVLERQRPKEEVGKVSRPRDKRANSIIAEARRHPKSPFVPERKESPKVPSPKRQAPKKAAPRATKKK